MGVPSRRDRSNGRGTTQTDDFLERCIIYPSNRAGDVTVALMISCDDLDETSAIVFARKPCCTAEPAAMSVAGVRRGKAALSSGCESHPANRSSRKQPEQL